MCSHTTQVEIFSHWTYILFKKWLLGDCGLYYIIYHVIKVSTMHFSTFKMN